MTGFVSTRGLLALELLLAFLLLLGGAGGSAPALAAGTPRYLIKATWGDTNLPPGGMGQFIVQARNVGDGTSEEPLTIVDELPAGVVASAVNWSGEPGDVSSLCSGIGTELVTCTVPAAMGSIVPLLAPAPSLSQGFFTAEPAGYLPAIFIDVEVAAGVGAEGTNRAAISGGGAPAAADIDQVPFAATPSSFGLVPGSYGSDFFAHAFPDEVPARQAGDHPFELRTAFDLKSESHVSTVDGTRETLSNATVETAEVELPPGTVGNPYATPRCSPVSFTETGPVLVATGCAPDTQVGYLNLSVLIGGGDYGRGGFPNSNEILTRVPLYSLLPPKGMLGDFAFSVGGLIQGHIYPRLDPSRDYALTALVPYVSSIFEIRGAEITLWGVPADPAHDRFRYLAHPTEGKVLGAPFGGAPIRPLLTLPMDCGTANGGTSIRLDSYQHPGDFTPVQENAEPLEVGGCEDPRIRFEPTLSLRPTATGAGEPTGLEVHLNAPQRDDIAGTAAELYAENGFVKGIATPPLRRAAIELPPGMTVSPSVAQGLSGCSPAEIDLGTDRPAACPAASMLGTVRLDTPILSAQIDGSLFLARPYDNPFKTMIAFYLEVEGQGLNLKLPVRFDVNPADGRITATIDDLPQQPIASLSLRFNGGPRGVLSMPKACGTYATHYRLASWSDPETISGFSSFTVDRNCSERAFAPRLSAGTVNPVAGASSPFVLQLSRDDGEQNLSSLTLELPAGLSAVLGDASLCPDVLAATGACPESSRIGSASLALGSGSAPLQLPRQGAPSTGVYLGGPYRGAAFSFVLVIPGKAGPFDLGTVVSRAALDIDPHSARGTLRVDPLPQLLRGVPIEYRTLRLLIDRPGFVVNPSSCTESRLLGSAISPEGSVAPVSDRFQVGDCARLGFRPRFSLRLSGGTARNGHPALTAVLRPRPGDANLRSASVLVPRGIFIDPAHLTRVCTEREFAARDCPRGSVEGRVRAWSPLIARPLQGPIYLRESDRKYPDLAADLEGLLRLSLTGHLETTHRAVRAAFDALPDVPVTRIELVLKGGRRGLLVSSEDLCQADHLAIAGLTGQNGIRRHIRLQATTLCHP